MTYLVDNRPATNDEIAIIKSFTPDKNTDSGRQGTYKKIEIRKPSLNNIYLISLAGQRYFIKDNLLQLDETTTTQKTLEPIGEINMNNLFTV